MNDDKMNWIYKDSTAVDKLESTLEELKENKSHIMLVDWQQEILLDYITNLQQQLHQASLDIQELTERDIECPSWCDKLTNLQQEIENKNNEIDILKDQVEWWRQQCDDLEMQIGESNG